MKIMINGLAHEFSGELTGAGLLEFLSIGSSAVVVELNGEIIPRNGFPQQVLLDGDVLEIVTVVGGG